MYKFIFFQNLKLNCFFDYDEMQYETNFIYGKRQYVNCSMYGLGFYKSIIQRIVDFLANF